jgi:N6-L-threonylcarbamoyladenine synthase
MIILGIDTSCDDTCIALLKIENCKLKILSNVVSSQVKLHAKYGGVYPFLAKREHQRNLPIVLKKALRMAGIPNPKSQIPNSKQIQNSKFKIQNIDLIGVTVGPGLEPCLWQGVNFAKELAEKLKLPIIPVNHVEAHILVNFLGENLKFEIRNSKLFPAICLVVSGGHTQLILMKKIGEYKLIGETRDDAAGECFDKVARILGLGYPGGPAIAQQAEQWKSKIKNQKSKIILPRPMIYQKNYDFSFSGLKTAVLYQYQKSKIKNQKYKQEICAEVQQAIIDVLISKTLKAAKEFRTKSIILGGGVAANKELRKLFRSMVNNQMPNVKFFVPPENLCTDNAAMVAITAYFHRKEKFNLSEIKANANLEI